MEHRPKQSYTIPCSTKFLRDIRSLAAKEKTNIGDLARLAFFLFPLETIRTWQDPGGPPKHDRELVRVRSGPNAGKNMLRKPRIQVRLRGKYSAADIRTALDLALEMKKKNIFDLKNLSDRRWLMSPVKSKTLDAFPYIEAVIIPKQLDDKKKEAKDELPACDTFNGRTCDLNRCVLEPKKAARERTKKKPKQLKKKDRLCLDKKKGGKRTKRKKSRKKRKKSRKRRR